MKRDFHITTYTNTYNATMYNSNNITVIIIIIIIILIIVIIKFLSCYLSNMIGSHEYNKIFHTTVGMKIMCFKGIVVKCRSIALISPRTTSQSTNDQHPNQSSVNTQLALE